MARTREQVFSIEKNPLGSGCAVPGGRAIIVRTSRRESLDVLVQAMDALSRKLALARNRQQAARIARLTEGLIEGATLSADKGVPETF